LNDAARKRLKESTNLVAKLKEYGWEDFVSDEKLDGVVPKKRLDAIKMFLDDQDDHDKQKLYGTIDATGQDDKLEAILQDEKRSEFCQNLERVAYDKLGGVLSPEEQEELENFAAEFRYWKTRWEDQGKGEDRE